MLAALSWRWFYRYNSILIFSSWRSLRAHSESLQNSPLMVRFVNGNKTRYTRNTQGNVISITVTTNTAITEEGRRGTQTQMTPWTTDNKPRLWVALQEWGQEVRGTMGQQRSNNESRTACLGRVRLNNQYLSMSAPKRKAESVKTRPRSEQKMFIWCKPSTARAPRRWGEMSGWLSKMMVTTPMQSPLPWPKRTTKSITIKMGSEGEKE